MRNGDLFKLEANGTVIEPADRVLLCTVGLPRSGKSTWACQFRERSGAPLINPDSFRFALHGQRFCPTAERHVWAAVHMTVRALFLAGHPLVIVDATNVSERRRSEWISSEWQTAFVEFPASAQACIERAAETGDPGIVPVIRRMAQEFEPLRPGHELRATILSPPTEPVDSDEKRRRVYYQDIVYAVCNALDRIDGRRPGQGIVCGTVDEPSIAVQERLLRLVDDFKTRGRHEP